MTRILILGLLLLNYFTFPAIAASNEEIWILIDTKKLNLEVKKGDKTVSIMNDIAIGRGGAGHKQRIGDDITPLGTYQIGWVNNKSPFHRFYGFNYPSIENANEALLGGSLSKQKYDAIINAHLQRKTPPQNTPIGGRIGIHGLGKADKSIHKMMNWTHGCIALTDEQVDRLGKWISKGTRVKIK